MHHIESAIQTLFAASNETHKFPWTTKMPCLKLLGRYRTKYYPMMPVMKDESTTSNNIGILEDLYCRQINVKSEGTPHHSELRLIMGDLKTWRRIEAVKTLRAGISEDAFDQFRWLLPSIGLWHLRFNMLQLLHAIHFSGKQPADPSDLQWAADRWRLSRVVQPNDFQALEDLIIHSYQARVVGSWIRILRRQKTIGTVDRIEQLHPWLEAQQAGSSGSWMQTLERISDLLSAPHPTTPPQERLPVQDQEFQNHQNFCANVEVYLTLRYAIKHADIGLLRHALRRVTMVFQAEVAGTPNYSYALLRVLHMVDSPAASVELQDSILANSLVNLRGGDNTNFEVDRLLELLNNNLKAFQKERSYFSPNSDRLLESWSLNGPYLVNLKTMVERHLGHINSSEHPPKSAQENIWSMAITLAHKSLVDQALGARRYRFSMNPTVNLFTSGLEKLGDSVRRYNQRQDLSTAPISDPTVDPEVGVEIMVASDESPSSPTLPSTLFDTQDAGFVE